MNIEPLTVPDAYLVTPQIFSDDRGSFLEWYRHEALTEAVGHPLVLAQVNCSTSRRGAIRGIHYAEVPVGQAKYVSCLRGAVLDVVVDLRVGSPTFGRSATVRLDDESRRAVYLSEGLGHGFYALTDDATIVYLCSSVYNPAAEHGIHPLDADLALPWPDDADPVLSAKDEQAPALAKALELGVLPSFAACQERYATLSGAALSGAALRRVGTSDVQA